MRVDRAALEQIKTEKTNSESQLNFSISISGAFRLQCMHWTAAISIQQLNSQVFLLFLGNTLTNTRIHLCKTADVQETVEEDQSRNYSRFLHTFLERGG